MNPQQTFYFIRRNTTDAAQGRGTIFAARHRTKANLRSNLNFRKIVANEFFGELVILND